MAKPRELSQKLREEIISLHQVPRDTVGSIMCKFKTHGSTANLPGVEEKVKFLLEESDLL